MKKQPELTAITKENLTSAFWSLYKAKRIGKITVKEITSIAGYNRSTFYEYFKDVYSVLDYVEGSLLDYMKEDVLNGLNFLDHDEVIKRITDMFMAKGEYLSMLLSEEGDPFFVGKFKAMIKPIAYSYFSIKETSPYSSYIFEFVMSAIFGTITHWYQKNDEIALNDVIRMSRMMLYHGTLIEIQKQYQ